MRCVALPLALALVACKADPQPEIEDFGPAPASSEDAELAKALDEAAAGIEDEELDALLRDHWRDTLERAPVFATSLGVHRWDDRLADPSRAAELEARESRKGFLARAESIDPARLTTDEAQSLRAFLEQLRADESLEACEFSSWSISARSNPLGQLNRLPRSHPLESWEDGEALMARYRAIPSQFDHAIGNLRRGLEAGRVANRESVQRVVEMLDRELAKPAAEWAAATSLSDLPPKWTPAQRSTFALETTTVLDQEVRPAAERYLDFLRRELLVAARDDDNAGLAGLDIGERCYAALIQNYVTLPMSAQEIHELGLREMERINAEMQRLGKRLFALEDLPAILERLRNDPALHFSSAEEVESFARAALADARAALPRAFGRLPEAECVVTPIPEYEAPFTTIAYYQPPHADGSKPGEYYINTYAPETRPRYEARVLAYHESVPGHHLQIAIAQELPETPAFRKHAGQTVFVEGWALYTERLSDELGLYPEDLDRMGVLSFDAWRAGRLVVDTGIHAMGWSRQRAIDYLVEHTALAENNIDNEVDRYVTTPGQALAYKIGQLEITKLREEARSRLGERFELADFHDLVLSGGAMSIPMLRDRVAAWLSTSAN